MAKRKSRLNLKFIAIGALSVIGLGVIYLILHRTVLKPHAEAFVTAAQADMAKQDWEAGVKDLGKAVRYARTPDPAIWLMLADCYSHLMAQDYTQNLPQFRQCLGKAMQIDPRYVPGLKVQLEYELEFLQFTPGARIADVYKQLSSTADALLAEEPKNTRARYVSAYSLIDRRMSGIAVDRRLLDQAEQNLKTLLTDAPTDPEVPFVLAHWMLFDLRELDRTGHPREARERYAEAMKLIEDTLVKQKDIPLAHSRMAQSLMDMAEAYPVMVDRPTTAQMAEMNRTGNRAPTTALAATLQKKRSEIYHRAYAELEKAASTIKPEDPRYVEVRTFYARMLERPIGLIDPDEKREVLEKAVAEASAKAESTYRDVLTRFPTEAFVRLSLGDFLSRDAKRRDDAIAVLSENTGPNPAWIGAKGQLYKQGQIMLTKELANVRLDAAETKSDKAEREQLVKQAQGDVDRLASLAGENTWPVLELKGRVQFLHNEAVAAAQTFERAIQAFPSVGRAEDRGELQYHQARAFMATNQTAEARNLLRDVIAINPANWLARLQLAELLIREGNIKGTPPRYDDGATAQLDMVETYFSTDHPLVVRLRLRTLDREKDKLQFDKLWNSIPEKTVSERYDKARLAAQINFKEDSIRLLEAIRAEKPDLIEPIPPLVNLYIDAGDKPAAVKVLDEAIAKNPNDKTLPLLKAQIVDPAKAQEERLARLQAMTDPLKKEVGLADYYRDTGDNDKMLEHLLNAEKIQPDNPNIWMAMFEVHLARQEWDQAQSYLEKITKKTGDTPNTQTMQLRMELAHGNLDRAMDLAQKLTKSHTDFAMPWVLLGQTQQARQKYDDAIAAYNAALDKQTENLDALRGLIDCSYAKNDPGKASNPATGQKATGARLYIEMGQRIFPYSPLFKELDLRWQIAFGNPEKAIEPRAQAVKDHPDLASNYSDLAQAYVTASEPRKEDAPGKPVDTNAQNANTKLYLGKARDVLKQAVAKFPEENRFYQMLIDVQLRLGTDADIADAEKSLGTFLSLPANKNDAKVPATYADFYLRAQKPDKAIKVLTEAIQKNPKDASNAMKLSAIYQSEGKLDEALKSLESFNEDQLALRQRVNLLLLANRTSDASDFVNSLIAKDPNNMFYTRLRANVDLAQGNLEACRSNVKKILAADANDVDGLYIRGRAQLADPHGDVVAAIEDLDKVVKLQPSSIAARTALADAYQRRGNVDDAIRTVQGAIVAFPADKDLRMRLFALYANASRWFDVENLLKDTRAFPQFADDVDFAHFEAGMWLERHEPIKALERIKFVMSKQKEENLFVTKTYLEILKEQKDWNTLRTEVDKLIQKYPNKIWWTYQLRAIARKNGQADRRGALVDFNQALQLAIANRDQGGAEMIAKAIDSELGSNEARQVLMSLNGLDAHWQLVVASMLAMTHNQSEALAAVEKVLAGRDLTQLDMDNALKIAGTMYMTSDPPNIPKAIEAYRKFIKDIPNSFEALNNLAYLLLEDGPTRNPKEALEYAQRVLELVKRTNASDALPLVTDTYAWALINCDRVDEGISLLREAVQKRQFPEGFFHLGMGYMKLQPPKVLDALQAFDSAKSQVDEMTRRGDTVDAKLKLQIDKERDKAMAMKK